MDKRTELNNAMKEAMKSKDQLGLATVRLILSAIKDKDINSRGTAADGKISDSDILSLLQSMIKQRAESAEIYRQAKRDDLLAQEESEIAVIKRFLPQQMDEAAVKGAIDGLIAELNITGVKDMGRLMAELKSRYAGQMDMSQASGLIKSRLSA